jgi:peptide deformylase
LVLPLRYVPDPVLARKAQKVTAIDAALKRFVQQMLETMRENKGVGLAANQVGSLKRVAVIHLPDEEAPLILVNPRITRRLGEREIEEGCLSIPGYQGLVKRAVKVCVRAQDLSGQELRITAENDLLAQVLEHEIDHLDGILYIQRLVSKDSLWKVEQGKEEEAEGGERAKAEAESSVAPAG